MKVETRVDRLIRTLRKRRPLPSNLPALRLNNLDDVRAALADSMNDVRSGKMSHEVGRAVAALCQQWLKADERRESELMDAEIAELQARQQEILSRQKQDQLRLQSTPLPAPLDDNDSYTPGWLIDDEPEPARKSGLVELETPTDEPQPLWDG